MPRCHYCGQFVHGEYIVALGATWHPAHFLCAGCGRPLGHEGFVLSQDQPYHRACYLAYQAPRCVYCQQPLTGKYLVDGWGNIFCPKHEEQYPRCAFCSRLIPPQQQQEDWLAYGCQRCATCRATAIETAEQAQPLFRQCTRWIGQQGFRFHQLPLHLELCARAKLVTLLQGRSANHPLGVTLSSTTYHGHAVTHRVEGVAVLQGMPALLFSGVVLHELGHVWLAVHGIEGLPLWAEEGFCQLLSHRYYASLDTHEARYHRESLERERDPIYGDGFRRARALSERMGFEHLVETLQRTKRWP